MEDEQIDDGETIVEQQGIGQRLREAREAKGLSLEQVAAETRIQERYLTVIEAGDFAALPSRTYAIGFTRTYARTLGLDEHEATDQVRAELAEREAQLALLADNVKDAVLRLDLNGNCIYASPSSKQLFGIHHSHMVGNKFITGFHPDDAEEVNAEFGALAKGETEQVRIAFRSEHLVERGNYQWIEANCALVRDHETGEPREIIASLRNIDETKRLQSELTVAKENAEAATKAKSIRTGNGTPFSGTWTAPRDLFGRRTIPPTTLISWT